MKKKTKKQELVARPHFFLLVFYFQEKRVKIYLNKKALNFEFTNLRALGAFAPYTPSRLKPLCAFAPYVPSCLTCLCALGASIFTCLNYALCVPYLLFARLSLPQYIFISSSVSFFRINYFNGYVSIIVIFIIIIIIINSF